MKDLTQGPIRTHLLKMSGAFLLNSLTGMVFALINLFWLGRLGASAQAAVTLAAFPVMLVLTLLPILNMGAGVLISHAVGAQDQTRANRIFNEAFGASLVAMGLIGVVAWINREAFGHLLSSDPQTAAAIADYYRWFIPSVVVQVPLLLLATALEFTGNVRTGTIAQTGTVVLNATLAPVLIFGWFGAPRLGVAGAGLAAFIACGLTVLALFAYLARRSSYLSLRPGLWLTRPQELWSALKIGLPTGIESGVVAAYLVVIALLLRPFGASEQAAFGIGQRIFQAGLMPLMALSGATCVMIGQHYGAQLNERMHETLRTSLRLGMIIAPMLLLMFEAFAPWICSRLSTDAAVIEAGARFLRITAWSLIPASFAYSVFATLSGMGNTRASLFTQLTYASLVIVLAGSLSFLPGFEPWWVWSVMVLAGLVQALMAWRFLRRQFGRQEASSHALSAAEATATE